MSDEDGLSAEDHLAQLEVCWQDCFSKLTSIRDRIQSYGKSKFSLVEAKYKAGQEVMLEVADLRKSIHRINLHFEPDKRVDYSKKYSIIEDLFEAIEVMYCEVKDACSRSAGTTVAASAQTPGQTPPRQIKLPNIVVPPFENTVRAFPKFLQMYECVYGQNPTLSGAAKLYYLKTLLKGEALDLISEFAMTDQGYLDSIKALKDMYQSERALASIHITDILTFQPLMSPTGESLRNFLSVHKHHVASLKALNIPDLGDFLLQELCARNLDTLTRKLFEQQLPAGTIPTHKDLVDFVTKQAHTLDLLKSEKGAGKLGQNFAQTPRNSFRPRTLQATSVKDTGKASSTRSALCNCCHSGLHKIYSCEEFLKLNPKERLELVQKNKLCQSCLARNHFVSQCNSKKTCQMSGCNARHHTTLHMEPKADTLAPEPIVLSAQVGANAQEPVAKNLACHGKQPMLALLGTLVAKVYDGAGYAHSVRCVLDAGSQENLCAERLVHRLGLRVDYRPSVASILGIGDRETVTKGTVGLTLNSRCAEAFRKEIKATVVPHITSNLPSIALPKSVWEKYSGLDLADPSFSSPGPIDLLLNVSFFMKIVKSHPLSTVPKALQDTVMDTHFGKVIMGELPSNILSLSDSPPQPVSLLASIAQFWEVEEVPCKASDTEDSVFVEKHFLSTYNRDKDGRFRVALPFIPGSLTPGENRKMAIASLISLEKRLQKSPTKWPDYQNIMVDYVKQGHIEPTLNQSSYILTHHCVTKKDSTKLRVVINASIKGANSISFNDTLYRGPVLHRDLTYVLTGFRLAKVALVGDISSMFMNVALQESSAEKLHIFFRQFGKILEYRINSLPFGLKCSPFLAMRCLRVLAEQECSPRASLAILKQSYVDNFLCGADSVEEALAIRKEITEVLARGQFPLSKFGSSHGEVIADLPPSDLESSLQFSGGEGIKILGLVWQADCDFFSFKVKPFSGPVTKRNVLSYVSGLFDPVGLINPVVFSLKLFIQTLWLDSLGWDEKLPPLQAENWLKLSADIPLLSTIKIPRWVAPADSEYFLAAMADGSQSGYGCCVYLVSKCKITNIFLSHLIFSKSKVAPIKRKLTIPEMELSALLLASKMIKWFNEGEFPIKISSIHVFSDSMVALAWVNTLPAKLKIFVANRVRQINLIKDSVGGWVWHFIKSEENYSSDLLSRGTSPKDLVNNSFWFNGPPLLRENFPPEKYSGPGLTIHDAGKIVENVASKKVFLSTQLNLLDRYSSYTKLLHVVAYVFRYMNNLRKRNPRGGGLCKEELDKALVWIVKVQQQRSFADDLGKISQGKVPSDSLLPLTPFIDSDGILRVGGRLSKANLDYNTKHPIILPRRCNLTASICRYYHLFSGHSGPALSLALVRSRFWPINGKAVMREITQACVTCVKLNIRRVTQPIMGDLPKARTEPTLAFRGVTALDAAGPFMIKLNRRQTRARNSVEAKGYLLIWVCLGTRACHLEFMSSMSTETFFMAWERMIARRGAPRQCLSDRGSNFCGAARKVKEFSAFLENHKDEILSNLASRSIDWQFINVASPSEGGIYERQIGVAKRILKGLIGEEKLSYEEYLTMFAKTEILLNSRPYTPLSNSPNEPLNFLTPAHFILQAGFAPLPDVPVDERLSLRGRWDRVRRLTQVFWKKWSSEYLHTQIMRGKWARSVPNLEVGQVVLLKNETTTPANWPLGVVKTLYPGSQGAVRSVDVRTVGGVVRRAVNKLVVLPVQSE